MKSKTMEYQTARDLPFAEAGTKVELSLSEGCIPMSLYNIKDCGVTISKEFIGQLLCEGWIKPAESVKPREWVINIGDDGAAIFKDGKMLFKFGRVDTPVIEKIKVRECLDE